MEQRVINTTEGIPLKEVILNIKTWWQFVLTKWKVLTILMIAGGVVGALYSFTSKPTYYAFLSFALQDDKSSGGGLGNALGIASQLGVDIGGGSTGGEFAGDNLLELMKSRLMVEKTLLSSVNYNGRAETLADLYIEFNDLRSKWKGKPKLENISYPVNADASKFTLTQDSVLGVLYKNLVKSNFNVEKIDKRLSIITVKVISTNETFSKYFAEHLTKLVSDFYIQTKTQKASKNVNILQRQTDSVRRMLNGAIAGVAASTDVNPNPNPYLSTLRVPSQHKQVDVQANTAILSQLVTNLEIAKMSLLQETPLIQIIDTPILPLEKTKTGFFKATILGGVILTFLGVIVISLKRLFENILK